MNTSLKQDEGQFFTPYRLVDFIVSTLDIKTTIQKNLEEKKLEFIPTVIDYACGSEYFLNSYINEIKNVLIKMKFYLIMHIKIIRYNSTKSQSFFG